MSQPTNAATAALEATAVPAAKTLIRTITIDTFTAIQKNQIFDTWEDGKIRIDEWKDFGVDIVQFCRRLRELGFTLVGVLGYEGTGKSYGMKFLPPKTNIWFNTDDKMCTYKGGKDEYGTRTQPKYTQKIARTYDEIIQTVTNAKNKGMLAPNPVAFLIGHIEDYKSGEVTRQRLKTFSKIARTNVEDMFEMCYYTELVDVGGAAEYKFRTQNNGRNTGRSMEGQHEDMYIDNNFQTIIESFDNY